MFSSPLINFRRISRLPRSESTATWVYRLMCWSAVAAILSFGVIIRAFYPEYVDPTWMRGGMAAVYVAVIALSYTTRWVRTNLATVCRGSVYVLIAWVTYITALNHFNADMAVGLVVIINIAALGIILDLHRPQPLAWYLGYTLVVVVLALLGTPSPQVGFIYFMSLLLVNMYVVYLVAEGRLAILWQRRQAVERYQAFAATASEGFFQFTLEVPLNPNRMTREETYHHLLVDSRLAECNSEMCKILGVQHPEEVLGASLQDLSRAEAEPPARRFIEEGFRLIGWNHSHISTEGRSCHFVVNAVGTYERDRLASIVGSCTDVTEQVERERRMVGLLEEHEGRIGRDLHDEAGQILTGLRMLSNSLAGRYFKDGGEGYDLARQVARLAKEAHSSIQRIYQRLIPRQLESDTLAEALEGLSLQANALPGVTVHFTGHEGPRSWDPEVKLQLFRIAQEALANAIKHASASEIAIGLCTEDQGAVLQVCDNGIGFDVRAAMESTEAIGLYSMRYRAHSIKAVLEIDSAPGAGTRVRCTLPAVVREGDFEASMPSPRPDGLQVQRSLYERVAGVW